MEPIEKKELNEASEQTSFFQEKTIFDLLILIIRNWWIIGLVGTILALGVYAYSKTSSIPSYRSSGSLYIDTQREQKNDDVNANALIGAKDLMPTYIEILESRTFFQKISDAIGNKYSYKELESMTYMQQTEGTNIMTIEVVCIDERDSYLVCSSIIENATDEIIRVFEGGSVKIIDRPEEIPEVIAVNSFRRGIIGFILGAALAIAILYMMSIVDTRIESTEELTSKYKIPVLGEVSNLINEK